MLDSVGLNYYGYYNNNLARPNIAFRGENQSLLKVKDTKTKQNSDNAAALMLGGGILATVSAVALYFLTKGKSGAKTATEFSEQVSKGANILRETGNEAGKGAGNVKKGLAEALSKGEKLDNSGGRLFSNYEIKTKEDFEAIIGYNFEKADQLDYLVHSMCFPLFSKDFNKLPADVRLKLLDKLATKIQKLDNKTYKPIWDEMLIGTKASTLLEGGKKVEALQVLKGLSKENLIESDWIANLYLKCGQLNEAKEIVLTGLKPHTKDVANDEQARLVKTLSNIFKAQSKNEDAEILDILLKGEYQFDKLTKDEITKLVSRNIDYKKLTGENGREQTGAFARWVLEQYGK